MNTSAGGGVYGPVADEHTQRFLHIYYAKPSNDNEKTRLWEPTGEHIKLKSHKGGRGHDAVEVQGDFDLSGIQAGIGRGFVSVQIASGADDEAYKYLVLRSCQLREEVIVEIRDWQLYNKEWTNTKAVALWCYISNARLSGTSGSLTFEVHVARIDVMNDTLGSAGHIVDCVTGSSGDRSVREPQHLAPPDGEVGPNWGEPIT